jgi:hypothetical protein
MVNKLLMNVSFPFCQIEEEHKRVVAGSSRKTAKESSDSTQMKPLDFRCKFFD